MLDEIKGPKDLRGCNASDLRQIADELRNETIKTVAITGGHLGSGVGVVDLTAALHNVFDTPRDRLTWGVGHQAYPHKILTGRRAEIHSLRAGGGLSSYDQVVHNVAIQTLPVRFAIDRAGFVGADGLTHAGSFDIAYLGCLPGFVIMAAADEAELAHMIATAAAIDDRPSAVRYPRGDGVGVAMPEAGVALEIGRGRIVRHGEAIALLSLGARLAECTKAAAELGEFGLSTTVADARFAKPLDLGLILKLAREHEILITVEEGSIGGIGSQVLHALAENGLLDRGLKVRSMVFPDQDRPEAMYAKAGLDSEGIVAKVFEVLGRNPRRDGQISSIDTSLASRRTASQRAPMRVVLAQPRGFCAGVVRAIDVVERSLRKYDAPVYVRHEIVHNKPVVEELKAKGAHFVEDVSEIPPNAVAIFSAHGVSRKVEKDAAARQLVVHDATCPLVAKVHKQNRRYVAQGRKRILIGHARHPEVEGTMGQVPAPVILVQTKRDVEVPDLPADTPIAYVTQTTLSVDDTKNIVVAPDGRFHDIVGPDVRDICYATQNRQMAVRELCGYVDLGSNSNRLHDISLGMGVRSHLIADSSELRSEWFDNVKSVGITAGASAPEVLVEAAFSWLRRIGPVEVSTLNGPDETVEFRLPPELASVSSPPRLPTVLARPLSQG